MVSRYIARQRVESGWRPGRCRSADTSAGAEAEIDFSEFYASIAGLVVKCWMFVMRLSHPCKAIHVAFAAQAQEAFVEGHGLAFTSVVWPARIRYDNLKPAVIRVLKGRDRRGTPSPAISIPPSAWMGGTARPRSSA
jgi:hypothetical protein